MVFDWFRRSFDSSPEKQEAETPPGSEAEPTTDTPEDAPEDALDDGAADYLAWAKAAYQNLKQQQGEGEPVDDTPPESVSEPPESEVEETEASEPTTTSSIETANVDVTDAKVADADVAKVARPAPLESLPEPESSPAPEISAESLAEATQSDTESTDLGESKATAPASFLERAGAARQSRLEQLKATAIEAPEPESATPEATPQTPAALEFDEDFLWSAEVLAAEGREPEEVSIEEIDWLKQLRQGLTKTRRTMVNQLKSIVGQGPLNEDAVMEIEALLLQADVGVEATDYIVEQLQAKLREEALPPEEAIAYLKNILRNILDKPLGEADTPVLAPTHDTLNIWFLTGVNGAGKTTTIGKLAHLGRKSGYTCLIAAADTFRAAAVQQVQTWGDRSGVEVIANPGQNTDPGAVVFDGIAAAKARNIELLLVDTAGRLQNKKNLMAELGKMRRIIDKNAKDAQVESLLVLDATLGQNGVRQAQLFAEAANLTGVVLTKLDGSARGGVALAVTQQLGLPIRFVGAGEGIGDLRPFSSYEFVEALLSG